MNKIICVRIHHTATEFTSAFSLVYGARGHGESLVKENRAISRVPPASFAGQCERGDRIISQRFAAIGFGVGGSALLVTL
jgi:hypothetical protein